MSFSKWIGAGLGWAFGGPIGAIIGIALAGIFDSSNGKNSPFLGEGKQRPNRPKQPTYSPRKEPKPQTQSGDFEVSLLI